MLVSHECHHGNLKSQIATIETTACATRLPDIGPLSSDMDPVAGAAATGYYSSSSARRMSSSPRRIAFWSWACCQFSSNAASRAITGSLASSSAGGRVTELHGACPSVPSGSSSVPRTSCKCLFSFVQLTPVHSGSPGTPPPSPLSRSTEKPCTSEGLQDSPKSASGALFGPCTTNAPNGSLFGEFALAADTPAPGDRRPRW